MYIAIFFNVDVAAQPIKFAADAQSLKVRYMKLFVSSSVCITASSLAQNIDSCTCIYLTYWVFVCDRSSLLAMHRCRSFNSTKHLGCNLSRWGFVCEYFSEREDLTRTNHLNTLRPTFFIHASWAHRPHSRRCSERCRSWCRALSTATMCVSSLTDKRAPERPTRCRYTARLERAENFVYQRLWRTSTCCAGHRQRRGRRTDPALDQANSGESIPMHIFSDQ